MRKSGKNISRTKGNSGKMARHVSSTYLVPSIDRDNQQAGRLKKVLYTE